MILGKTLICERWLHMSLLNGIFYGTFPKKQGIKPSKSKKSQVHKFSQGPGAALKINIVDT